MIHQSHNFGQEDSDGFVTPRCECGWTFGPVPDPETACDVLMEHAFNAGINYASAALR
jgi:hypothetical protein